MFADVPCLENGRLGWVFRHFGQIAAVWLRQLFMLTPLDEYVFNLPPQVSTTEVYVDDATVRVTGKAGAVPRIAVKAANGLIRAF